MTETAARTSPARQPAISCEKPLDQHEVPKIPIPAAVERPIGRRQGHQRGNSAARPPTPQNASAMVLGEVRRAVGPAAVATACPEDAITKNDWTAMGQQDSTVTTTTNARTAAPGRGAAPT